MAKGFKGISFPFRVGNKGGVVLSDTNYNEVPHIEESIEQIITTRKGERVMEPYVGCDLDTFIFEPNEPATHNIIKYQICEALKEQEGRIKVDMENIHLFADDNSIFAEITYTIIQFNTNHTYTFRIGGLANEN